MGVVSTRTSCVLEPKVEKNWSSSTRLVSRLAPFFIFILIIIERKMELEPDYVFVNCCFSFKINFVLILLSFVCVLKIIYELLSMV